MPGQYATGNSVARELAMQKAYLSVLQENCIDATIDATEPGARQYVALRETLGLR